MKTENGAGSYGRYRYWGDQKPDTERPLITFTKAADAVPVKISAADEGAVSGTIRIYGPVDSWGGYWGVSAKEVATALAQLGDVDRVIIRINSPGGDSFEGRAIMNLLRAFNAETVAVVDGLAASAASYIAVGCDQTVMAPGTMLMIHDTHTFIYGNADELRKQADVVDSISRSGAELYADVAGGTVEAWRELQRQETWFTASEAVDAKLADSVGLVPDAGPIQTAGQEEDDETGDDPVVVVLGSDDERAKAEYDLSIFHFAGRDQAPDPKPPTASAEGSQETEGGSAVAFSDEQLTDMRTTLGLPEDADEAAIMAALKDAAETKPEPKTADTAPKVPEGMVLVESGVWEATKADATAGRGAATELAHQKRDQAIEAAIKAGKTTPARREHWAKSWDADPEGTKQLLDGLEAGLVPVEEKGHAQDGDAETTLSPSDTAELDSFLSGFGLSKEDIDG